MGRSGSQAAPGHSQHAIGGRSAQVLLICAALAVSGAFGADWHTDEHEAFIGWKGETYAPHHSQGPDGGWIQPLSWQPRVYLYHHFLSETEAKHLRQLAAPQMRRSSTSSSSKSDQAHASFAAVLKRLSDPLIEDVSQRVAEWVQVPAVHQEDIQVLRYGQGTKLNPHIDTLLDDSPRLATVTLFLADPEEGGETAFSEGSSWISDSVQRISGVTPNCMGTNNVAVKPQVGDALLFYNLHPDGTYESSAIPTSCPVEQGHKWTATLYVHSLPFRPKQYTAPPTQPADPGECKDNNEKCQQWADAGECENNSGYMTGVGGLGGECRKACKACEVCEGGDVACWRRNREKAGYLLYDPETIL